MDPISRTVPLDEDGRPLERKKVEQYEAELRTLADRGHFNVKYRQGSPNGYDVVQDVTSAMRRLGVSLETPGNARFDLDDHQQEALCDGLDDYFG